MKRRYLGSVWLLLMTTANVAPADDTEFEQRVRPVLIDRCLRCHGPDQHEGQLRLDSRQAMLTGGDSGPAIAPGAAGESRIWARIEAGEMPPATEPQLTQPEKESIRRWLDAGAPMSDRPIDPQAARDWRGHWAFHKPDRNRALAVLSPEARAAINLVDTTVGEVPAAEPRPSRYRIHPIDAFVDAKLGEHGLCPAPPADAGTRVRRAYLDLLGLPPTPEQVDTLVQNDSPLAWESLIQELMQSPHYGERWGRHWLDVARYADSGGYETDILYRNAWRYRDYVVKSFNDDKPYDRFVQEQIAGDELWPDNLDRFGSDALRPEKEQALEAHIGTGFFALGPQIHESNADAPLREYERLTDQVDALGAAFLGVTIGCARCHDHKFDPFTQRDYFALQAVFSHSREAERTIASAMDIADFKQHYPRVLAVVRARQAFRSFEQSLSGRQPTPEEERRRQELLVEIGQRVLEIPERSAQNRAFDGLYELPTVTVLDHERPELVKPVHILARGELSQPGDPLDAALPAALAEATDVDAKPAKRSVTRKDLALWLTRGDHPLTARVLVNRVWHWHFGAGLVATPNDFGRMGQPPSHPELLDWLATEFVARGWSVKQLHVLIMTSQAYQRASDFGPAENLEADPDNRLLWRFNRRRLEAEAVWDCLHSVAGTLHLQMGGPPVMPPLTEEELTAMRERYRWIVSPDPQQHARRGLYIMHYRNFRFPLFEVFDTPNNSVSTGARDASTVATQSLWMLNNPVVWKQAMQLAGRVVRDVGDQPEAFIGRLWSIVLGRWPTEVEVQEATLLFERLSDVYGGQPLSGAPQELNALPAPRAAALVQLCLATLNHNEFLFID